MLHSRRPRWPTNSPHWGPGIEARAQLEKGCARPRAASAAATPVEQPVDGARDLAERLATAQPVARTQERQPAEVNAAIGGSDVRFGRIRQSIAEAQMRIAQRRRSTARKSTGNYGGNPGQCRGQLWEGVLGAPEPPRRDPRAGQRLRGQRRCSPMAGVIGPSGGSVHRARQRQPGSGGPARGTNLVGRIHSDGGNAVHRLQQTGTPRVTSEVTRSRRPPARRAEQAALLRAARQVDAAAMGKAEGPAGRPGMAVQVFVRGGRSLLNYWCRPCSGAHVQLAERRPVGRAADDLAVRRLPVRCARTAPCLGPALDLTWLENGRSSRRDPGARGRQAIRPLGRAAPLPRLVLASLTVGAGCGPM
ncbi:hypothetical protein ACPA9J_14230 [Pseudomonas aeruginosa]